MGPNDIQKLNQVAQAAAIDAAKKKAAAATAAAKLAEDQAKAAQKPNTAAPAVGQQSNGQQSNEEAGEEDAHALKKATQVAIEEFETGEHFAEIIDGVAEEYNIDPIELAKNLHSIGAIEDDELNEFISYVEATPGEDASEEVHKPGCPCKQCQQEREERSKSPEKQIEARYGNIDHLNDSVQITNFIKALSQKNYAVANKYLQGAVESKLKRSINNANNK